MDYNLSRIESNTFEALSLAVTAETTGVVPKAFRNGYYGGRDAYFGSVAIAWPAAFGGNIWDKTTVIHAEFLTRPSGTIKDTDWFHARIKEHLTLWQTARREATARRVHASYSIFITNVELVEVPGLGVDQINQTIRQFARELQLHDWKILHYGTLCNVIDASMPIRKKFAGYIAPEDAFLDLSGYRVGISSAFADSLKRQLIIDMGTDQWVRLSQLGDFTYDKLSLSSVGIDLPLSSESVTAARYIIGMADLVSSDPSDSKANVVLIGGPGQGKTTITQLVCQAYRAALLPARMQFGSEVSKLIHSTNQGLDRIGIVTPRYRRWPIRLDLSSYSDAAAGPQRTSLLKYIADKIAARTSTNVSANQVKNWLAIWPSILVLDGLDEVAAAFARDTLMDKISEFIVESELVGADLFVLATTRPQGYSGEFTADRFRHVSLAPLTPSQAAGYAERLAQVRHSDDPDTHAKVMTRVRAAAKEPFTARLMRTPLQVTIMSMLLEARERAPSARYELFDAYYQTIYARELAKPGPMARLLETRRNDINILHDRIGLLLQAKSEQSGEADTSLERRTLHDLSVQRLLSEGISKDEANSLAEELVAAVTRRLVLIVPKALDDIGFEVRSIQEFMAARAIVSGSDPDVMARVRAALPSVHWRNAWLFAAGRIFSEREHIRKDVLELLSEVDSSCLLNMVVAPGADIALDMLDDDLASTTPVLERMLARHTLTLLQYAPDYDLARRAYVIFRFAEKDEVIRVASEEAISTSLSGSPAQQKSAETVIYVWKDQSGKAAFRARKLVGELQLTAKRDGEAEEGWIREDLQHRLAAYVAENSASTAVSESLAPLVASFAGVRMLPHGADVRSASRKFAESPQWDVVDSALSMAGSGDLLAAAALDIGKESWSGSAEIRNLLRAWMQRRRVAESVMALTPFVGAGED